jgi:hypothetical protein
MGHRGLVPGILLLLVPACQSVDTTVAPSGDGPSCNTLVSGVRIDFTPLAEGLRLQVGESRRVDVVAGVPSACTGAAFFHRLEWSQPSEGPFEARLASCPCEIEYQRDEAGERRVVARATGPGTFSFDIVGRRPGWDLFSVTGYTHGPCGRGPGEPLVECGSFSMGFLQVRVVSP